MEHAKCIDQVELFRTLKGRVIDLNNDDAINAFYEVVKDIKMPNIYSGIFLEC